MLSVMCRKFLSCCILIVSLTFTLCTTYGIEKEVPQTTFPVLVEDGVEKIKQYILKGQGRHETYRRLAELSDLFGARMSGTEALEKATDYAVKQLSLDGFEVHTENVTVPRWVRGKESAEVVVDGRTIPLKILGLGTSVGTSGLTAQALVVRSFYELVMLADQVHGKIVVYNQAWEGYPMSAIYRVSGASVASKLGAVATLIRSLTPLSIYSPHTGMQNYGEAAPIPTACITVEDAEMLQRWHDRGMNMTIHMYMEARRDGEVTQRNVVAEIKGSVHPHQTLIFGGHFDSWDVGTGSLDDGGGVMIAWQTLRVLKALGLPVKRTVRLVLFTAEEQGIVGGQEYYRRHKSESSNVTLVMESDIGAFKPYGIRFSGSQSAAEMMRGVLRPLADLNMTIVSIGGGASSDTDQWVDAGVPGVELLSHNENYFYYHHSNGDSMSVMDADDLDLCTVLWSTIVYSVSNLDKMLPR